MSTDPASACEVETGPSARRLKAARSRCMPRPGRQNRGCHLLFGTLAPTPNINAEYQTALDGSDYTQSVH